MESLGKIELDRNKGNTSDLNKVSPHHKFRRFAMPPYKPLCRLAFKKSIVVWRLTQLLKSDATNLVKFDICHIFATRFMKRSARQTSRSGAVGSSSGS